MINMIEKVSSVIVTTIIDEIEKMGIEYPTMRTNSLRIEEAELRNKTGVVYEVRGSIGRLLDNPHVKLMYYDNFTEYTKPDIILLNVQVTRDYTTARLNKLAVSRK